MRDIARSLRRYPALTLSIGGAVIWGVMELVALQRSQSLARNPPQN